MRASLRSQLRVALSVLAPMALACATSPLGRSQLLAYPEAEMDAMGVAAFNELAKTTPRATNRAQVDYVSCVANTITRALPANVNTYDWEVVVFEDPTPNAFALPGGKIGVHTGLLQIAKNQDQLAAVIGHEVAHVLSHHGNERLSQQNLAQTGMSIVGAVLAPSTPMGSLALGALGLGVQYGALMPYSRKHESEADIYGLELSAKAGFDPRASVPLWQNMAAASEGQRPPEFLSTHPDPLTRIGDLQREIPRRLPDFQAARRASCG